MKILRQPSTQHEIEVEVFERNQAIGVDQPMGDFVPEVTADIGDVFVQLGDQQALLIASTAALLRAGQPPLGAAQGGKAFSQPTGVVNQRAVGQTELKQGVPCVEFYGLDAGSRYTRRDTRA
jgi:hypothetical protein